ncbi:tryptophan 7-halogenase [Pseudomonas sp. TH31]|uniref:tryptophan 7-halogenase n=1 Tax=Pseudomonas sp. TH31 TaxID=2796396 RepID=UPI001912E9CC|nr:tryptophan 7-halogenase [Pseudomonas sp. TH31]MBK5416174.1 tryptophan 7-halogenase [Pseudomonas sp. TH31]
MLNVRNIRRLVVVGGGTAGWFAALTLRRLFEKKVEIRVIESPDIGIVGVGEGGLINLIDALSRNNIAVSDFMIETGAAFKMGFCYGGWRGGGEQDKFDYLFANPKVEELAWSEFGGYPLISALIHQNYGLDKGVLGFVGRKKDYD